MGKSLYQISDELQLLLSQIEESGGEITEEQEKQLEIGQEELNNKVENYCNAITILKSEEECAKNEKKRLNDLQNVKKNLIEKLKNSLLQTVSKFGYTGKSGNKVLDVTNHKLFTKVTKSIVLNEDYIIELYKQGILETGENIDVSGMLGAINAIAKSEQGEGFVPYTLKDLSMINFRFEYKVSFDNIFGGKADDVAKLILSPNSVLNYEPNDYLKTYLEIDENEGSNNITFAQFEQKESITIK